MTGGQDGQDPVAARHAQLRAALIGTADLDHVPAPEPLIEGMLYRDSLNWLYGKPGTCKSFLALDWAGHVAAGMDWHGRAVTRGTTLYVIAEGTAGLRRRVRAWEDHNREAMPVTFLPVAVQLVKPVDRAAFTGLVADLAPAMVILDTQARVTVGLEENSTRETGELVTVADAIRAASRACVLIVHHEPRNGENMRGSIALEGAATSLFRAERDGSVITLRNTRQRDVPEADDVTLWVRPHQNSLVLVSNHDDWTLPVQSASEELIVKTLRDTAPDTGASATLLMELTGLSRTTFYNAVKALVRRGEVISAGTRNRSRYELPAGRAQLVSASVQPVSNGPRSPVSSVHPPFRGVDTWDTTGRDTAGRRPGNADWPEDSNGAAANPGAPDDWPPPGPGPPDWPPPGPP